MASLPEIVIILVALAIVFGTGSLTQLGKSIGKVPKEFKKGLAETPKAPIHLSEEEDDIAQNTDPKPGTKPQHIEDAEIEEV